jgi:hypothetical protein
VTPEFSDADIDYMVLIAPDGKPQGPGQYGWAEHQATHALLETLLRGKPSRGLDLDAPCPYCGKLPPSEP